MMTTRIRGLAGHLFESENAQNVQAREPRWSARGDSER